MAYLPEVIGVAPAPPPVSMRPIRGHHLAARSCHRRRCLAMMYSYSHGTIHLRAQCDSAPFEFLAPALMVKLVATSKRRPRAT